MDASLDLFGQSPVYQVYDGETVQVNLSLSCGRQVTNSPVTYSGTVMDQDTGKPVAHACVTLRNGPYIYRCKTLYDGRFKVAIPCHWSTASIQVCKEGYSTRYIGIHFLTQPNDVFYLY